MSRLQEEAKQFLVPLLLGKKSHLHRRAQRILAAWVAMTVMVAEFLYRDRLAIPATDRQWLRENRTAPAHWRIWVGHQGRKNAPMYYKNVLTLVSEEEFKSVPHPALPEGNTQTTTISLGQHLLIHVMSSVVGAPYIRRWNIPAELAAGLGQIWPIRNGTIRWPPRHDLTFSDRGIETLANEFFRRVTAYSGRKLDELSLGHSIKDLPGQPN